MKSTMIYDPPGSPPAITLAPAARAVFTALLVDGRLTFDQLSARLPLRRRWRARRTLAALEAAGYVESTVEPVFGDGEEPCLNCDGVTTRYWRATPAGVGLVEG